MIPRRTLWLAILSLACLGTNASTEMLRTVFDFQRSFPTAVVSNAQEASAVQNAKSGILQAPAIFEHPVGEGEASIVYEVALPTLEAGQTLAFVSHIGIRSGAHLDDAQRPFDGIGFSLLVNGVRQFRRVVLDQDPDSVFVDLSAFAGQRVSVSLNTDSNGQSNWDWALWLRPRIVLITPGTRPRPCGEMVLFEVRGLRGLEGDDPVQAVAGGQVLTQWWMPHTQLADQDWHLGIVEFQAPQQDLPVEIAAGPGLEMRNVRRFCLPPALVVEGVGSRRAILWPGERTTLVTRLRNTGPTPVLPQDDCRLALRVEGAATLAQAPEVQLTEVAAGAEKEVAWEITANRVGNALAEVPLTWAVGDPSRAEGTVTVEPRPATTPSAVASSLRIASDGDDLLLQTPALCLQLVGDAEGYDYGLIYAARGGEYVLLGALSPLSRVVYQGLGEAKTWIVRPKLASQGRTWVRLEQTLTDERGARWTVSIRLQLREEDPWIETRYRLSVDQTRNLLHFAGPTLLAGERCQAFNKDSALFPGLEALEGEERSSNVRDLAPPLNLRYVPNIYKITIPLLAVSDGESTLGLMWDMNRHWAPNNTGLAARFASPNRQYSQDNHLMGVFVPTPPQFMPENEELAQQPYVLQPGTAVTLSSQILVAPGDAFASIWQWNKRHGFPEPMPWPRAEDEELALCTQGFLETVWDLATQKSRHCIDWAPANSPGFATLLWWDSLVGRDQQRARQARARAAFIGEQTLGQQGAPGLMSRANCHIMRWEFPFYFGRLDEAFQAVRAQAEGLMASQEADGSWRFHPDEQRAPLGKAGDAVLGTCAGPAYDLWRYARLTGDPRALAAGEKALLFMRQFRVPRGAQAWECPLYEPDILAAAYAVLAYTDAYRATGNADWLQDAEYWAQSGVPFVYAWRLPSRPGMQHATIPVFGSTFFTHSWLGLPVQWNGLVYAYGLFHLADCGSPRADFWRTLAHGITVSGAYQQFGPDDSRAGTYPDSYNVWTGARNAAYINPEDIMVNLLAYLGHDPDFSSARASLASGARVHVSSGARVVKAAADETQLTARLRFFSGETTYSLIAGLAKPQAVTWEGRSLPSVSALSEAGEGWTYRDGLLFVRHKHRQTEGELAVSLAPPAS